MGKKDSAVLYLSWFYVQVCVVPIYLSVPDIFADLDKLSYFTTGNGTQNFNIPPGPISLSFGRGISRGDINPGCESVTDDINPRQRPSYIHKKEDIPLPDLSTFQRGNYSDIINISLIITFEIISWKSSSNSEQFEDESAHEIPLWRRRPLKKDLSAPEKISEWAMITETQQDSLIRENEYSSSSEDCSNCGTTFETLLDWNIQKEILQSSSSTSIDVDNNLANHSDTSGKTTPTHTPRRCRNALLNNLPSYNRETLTSQQVFCTAGPVSDREQISSPVSDTEQISSNTGDHISRGNGNTVYIPLTKRDDEFIFSEKDFPPL
ncbi:hypothetical protein C0J52_20693 [Blattella germanica]|nr:hypothetical protein C0J52_20693 [Blattella germanica]